jgi:hypothetical protein
MLRVLNRMKTIRLPNETVNAVFLTNILYVNDRGDQVHTYKESVDDICKAADQLLIKELVIGCSQFLRGQDLPLRAIHPITDVLYLDGPCRLTEGFLDWLEHHYQGRLREFDIDQVIVSPDAVVAIARIAVKHQVRRLGLRNIVLIPVGERVPHRIHPDDRRDFYALLRQDRALEFLAVSGGGLTATQEDVTHLIKMSHLAQPQRPFEYLSGTDRQLWLEPSPIPVRALVNGRVGRFQIRHLMEQTARDLGSERYHILSVLITARTVHSHLHPQSAFVRHFTVDLIRELGVYLAEQDELRRRGLELPDT